MTESKTTDLSPAVLWLIGVLVGVTATGGVGGLGMVLLMATVMSYDSPSRDASGANVAVGLVLAGLAVVALAGWVFGFAIPLRRARKLMLVVGALMLVLGGLATVTGVGIAMSGLAW